jgi:tripartite-type tricarboxylate transporter receptor subunit TctC
MGSIWDNAMTGFMAAAFIPPPTSAAHPEKRMRRPVKVLARRRFLQLAAGATALPAIPRIAASQAYPSRPITMIVPAAAGGSTDVVGRIMGERMGSSLGQPVIIENVSGADGSIGVGRAARARPDGYTIDIGITSQHVFNGAFYSLPYDVLNDFAPIAAVYRSALIIPARKTLPAKDLHELIAWLKANSNKASAAVFTIGGRLLATVFQKETGTQFALVPYRGTAPAMQDLVAGHIDLTFFDSPRISLPLVRAGSIKAYAVTSDTRLAAAPDIPTFAEMGLSALSYSEWSGLFAPAGTPRDIIDRLNAAAVEALADPAVRARLVEFGGETFPREQQTPEALGALVKADAEKWWPIIKAAGIRAE